MKNRKNRKSSHQHISKLQSQSEKGMDIECETTSVRSKRITTKKMDEPAGDEPAGPQKFFWSNSSPNPSDDDDDDVLDNDNEYQKKDPVIFAKHSQRMLELSCSVCRHTSYHGPEDEQKTCIWSGGDSFSWTEKSTGISWIGVQGTELVCALSSSKQKLLRWRPYGRFQMSVRSVHANAVADMGFWADISTKTTEFRRRIAQSSEAGGPFAVVSVAPNYFVDDKYLEISDKCQQRDLRAINFLQAELKVLDSINDDLKDTAAFAKHSQRMLELSCLRFRDTSYYGPEDEKSAGISWIGVCGTELVCVLSSSKQKVLRWRPYGRWQMSVRSVHANAVADMGYTSTKSTEFRRRIAQSSEAEGPFAVVSVAPNSVVDDKYLEISDKCQQRALRAINFLQAELKDRSSLSFEETVRMAVCALKNLLGPKFKPGEIEAFGFLKLKGPAVPNGADLRKAAMDLETSR